MFLVGLMAALPSIAWGLLGADYLSDDFWVAHGMVRDGVVEGAFDLSFVGPARPAVGPYYAMAYQLVGDRPPLQAVVLGALNAVVVVLVWHALRAVVSARTAFLAAHVLAVVPNRGATRMWFVLGPNLLAVGCAAAGALLLLRHARYRSASVLFVVAILAYEGVAVVVASVVVWWWMQDRRGRWRRATYALAPVATATLFAWAVSPKREGKSRPFANLDTLGAGQLGSGFWGSDIVGSVGMIVLVAAATWCIATVAFPSFRRPSIVRREVAIASVLLILGALPFAVGGAPFAVRGIFDRNNLVPDIGSCLLLGALLAAGVRRSRVAGSAMAVLVLAVLGWGNVQDVRDYRAAAREGAAVVDAVIEEVDPTAGTVVVRPPLPGDAGVAQFILDSDLNAALQLRHGPQWASVSMPATTPTCDQLLQTAEATGRPVFVYDRLSRVLHRLSGPGACIGR